MDYSERSIQGALHAEAGRSTREPVPRRPQMTQDLIMRFGKLTEQELTWLLKAQAVGRQRPWVSRR